jgi:hypothetical protein
MDFPCLPSSASHQTSGVCSQAVKKKRKRKILFKPLLLPESCTVTVNHMGLLRVLFLPVLCLHRPQSLTLCGLSEEGGQESRRILLGSLKKPCSRLRRE